MVLEECRPAPSLLLGGDAESPHRLHSRGIPAAEDAGRTAPQSFPAWKIGFASSVCALQFLAKGTLGPSGFGKQWYRRTLTKPAWIFTTFELVYIEGYFDGFTYILYSWDEANLIRMDDHFDSILDAVCETLINLETIFRREIFLNFSLLGFVCFRYTYNCGFIEQTW